MYRFLGLVLRYSIHYVSVSLGPECFIKAPQIIQIPSEVREVLPYPKFCLLFPLASQIRVLFSGINDVILIVIGDFSHHRFKSIIL